MKDFDPPKGGARGWRAASHSRGGGRTRGTGSRRLSTVETAPQAVVAQAARSAAQQVVAHPVVNQPHAPPAAHNVVAQPMAYQPHALPAAQVFSPPVAYQPPVPVLLEFVFGEQGSKQAADLRDKLPPAVKPLILDGFSVFEGLTAAQSSALHFHGGLVPLIAACWGTAHCPLGGLAAQLQQSSTSVEKLSKDYTEQLQEQISKADVFGRLVDDDDEVVVQALKISVILKSLWPQDIKKIWKHNQHFRHFRLASSSISDPLSTWDPLPPAQNVAILVSKSQTAAVLLDMMEDANLEQQTHNAFAEMLQKHASETWQQASLVSVLVQNPEDIKKITDSIKDTSVELLLTLEMECRTLKVHNTEGRLNDVSKRHTISIQLYAYAKLQIEGFNPTWHLSQRQGDVQQDITTNQLLDAVQSAVAAEFGWTKCKVKRMEAHLDCIRQSCELLRKPNSDSKLSIHGYLCNQLSCLAQEQGLLKPGTDLEDPDVARPHITLDVDITLDSKPPECEGALAAPLRKSVAVDPALLLGDGNGIWGNQEVIGLRIVERIFFLTDTAAIGRESKEAWLSASADLLRQKFPDGIDFRILTPRYKTLEQQTAERVHKAKLAESNNLETKVIQYDDSRKHWGEWQKFRQQIVNSENKKRLFITIADECHWGPVQGKVHDKMLNDYTISPDADDDLLQQENYIALLVSATPYNVLTEDSHLPERYLVVKEDELAASSQGLQLFDILAQPKSRGDWRLTDEYHEGGGGTNDGRNVAVGHKDLEALKQSGHVEELHVIDWFGAVELPATNGYRRLDAYLQSSLIQLQIEQFPLNGIFEDQVFQKTANCLTGRSKKQEKGAFIDDHVLMCSYLIALQFFRTFRWRRDGEPGCETLGDALEHPAAQQPDSGLWPATSDECEARVRDDKYMQEFDCELKRMANLHSFRELVLEVMEGMTLPDSADMSDRRRQTFLGWLAATPGCKEGNPDQTYWIVESLLGISYETSKAEEGQASSSVPPWRNSQVAAMGSMKVIRVSNVQVAGMHFVDMLKSFMKETQHPHSGPAWSGEAKALHGQPSVDWQLFAVIKDFSQNETHSLYQNVDGWFCQKPLCCSHPAWQKSSQVAWTLDHLADKATGLSYEDLHGVPCLLLLCERGRMGDTFPQTFDCLDMRLRASDIHTARVQELGRLCRYPVIVKGEKVVEGADSAHQVQEAFSFASGWPDVKFNKQAWQRVAMLKCKTAQDVFALADWLKAHKDEELKPENLNRLKQLLSTLNQQWPEDHELQAGSFQQYSSFAEIDEQLQAWKSMSLLDVLQHDDGQTVVFQDGKAVRVSVRLEGKYQHEADAATPEELLLLLMDCHSDMRSALKGATLTSFKLERFQFRLPYAILKSNASLVKLQNKLRDKRGQALSSSQCAQSTGHLSGLLNNMIVPSNLDSYVNYRRNSGADVMDFRHSYSAAAGRGANNADKKVSYDAHNSTTVGGMKTHKRRLLLSAECQIGKTGAYLAMLRRLERILQPALDVMVPDLDLTSTEFPPEADDMAETPGASIQVDYARWFEGIGGCLQWKCAYYPYICAKDKASDGQKMPDYSLVDLQKYGNRVLLQRIVQLVLAVENARADWAGAFVHGTESLHGELPMCVEALSRLRRIRTQYAGQEPPLVPSGTGWNVSMNGMHAMAAALNWDGRLRPFVQELVQERVLNVQGADRLSLTAVNGSDQLHLSLSQDMKEAVGMGNEPLGVVQKLSWPSGTVHKKMLSLAKGEKKVTTSEKYAYLAFQPGNLARQSAGPVLHFEQLSLDAQLKERVDVPELYSDVEMHILKHQLEALKTRGALAVEGNCIKSWSDTAWQRSSHTSIRHWIFTPSHGRASLPRQAFLDWSQAVTSGVQFVRVLVVRREDAEAYMQLVQDLSASENTEQFTLLMVMPEKLSLKRLGAAGRLSEAYASAIAQPGHSVGSSLGVGYARLFVQLVAHALSLTDVWMLDDNVQDCWKLDLEAESLRERRQHGQLQQCTFDNVMRDIEQFTSATQDGVSVTQDVPLDPPAQRMWNSMVSPRAAELQVDEHSQGDVQHWTDFGGSHKHVGIIGPSRQPYRHSLVGAKWAGGAGPPPFKVTHSLFCFYLLNVEATCSKQPMVLWPARQYAEDIEFHHMCEDHQLAVLKCNRFFFHKTNLQGRELAKAADATRSEPDFMFLPAEGPMWGGQQLQIQLVNQQDYASSATICGVPVQLPLSQPNSLQLTVQTPPLHEAPILAQSSSPEVLSGLIKLSFEGGSVLWSSQRYRYHGLWSWPQGISARDDIICSDPGTTDPEDRSAFWKIQSDFLEMKSGVWLPTIGVPADAQRVQVSTLSAGSVTNPFVLVSKPRELAFLLDVLRSCTKHGKITKDALRQSVILTRVADLTQQALGGYSLDSICRDNSFKLTAVYSTSKPISTSAEAAALCVPCQSVGSYDASEEGPFAMLRVELTTPAAGSKRKSETQLHPANK